MMSFLWRFCRGHSLGRKRALLPQAFLGAFGSFFPTDVGTKKMNPAIMNKRMGFDFHF
jgi:hypothetical protein